MKIYINGTDTATMGLLPVAGNADVLFKPVEYKGLTLNENDGVDGATILIGSRKAKSRDITLNFLLCGGATDEALESSLNNIINQFLIGYSQNGSSTGRCLIEAEGRNSKFYTVYKSCSKYQSFGKGKALVSFVFNEYNPASR